MSETLPRDYLDRPTLLGAAGCFAGVALVTFALPAAYRSDGSQLGLVAVTVALVGVAVQYRATDDRRTGRPGLRACAVGGGLCVLLVAAQAATKRLDFLPIIAASALVLPVSFGLLGHASASFAERVASY